MLSDAIPSPPDPATTVDPPSDTDAAVAPFDPLAETLIIFPQLPPRTALPELPDVQVRLIGTGEAGWISLKSPAKESPNEDSVGVQEFGDNGGLLIVADGLGGHRGGRNASQMVVTGLTKAVRRQQSSSEPLLLSKAVPLPLTETSSNSSAPVAPEQEQASRMLILEHIEKANQRLLKKGSGAATTLAIVEVSGQKLRTYHVGDSQILVISQRGRIKYETTSHSPVGYAQAAGILTEMEALAHRDRHLISNVVGSAGMAVELGPWIKLASRDTVLIASDGLFDNLFLEELVEIARVGRLPDMVGKLAMTALNRMLNHCPGLPSKPDDLTILAYRPRRRNA